MYQLRPRSSPPCVLKLSLVDIELPRSQVPLSIFYSGENIVALACHANYFSLKLRHSPQQPTNPNPTQPNPLPLFMGLKSSWIDFTTNDFPNIKVWYEMLISGRNLAVQFIVFNFLDSSLWILNSFDLKAQHNLTFT